RFDDQREREGDSDEHGQLTQERAALVPGTAPPPTAPAAGAAVHAMTPTASGTVPDLLVLHPPGLRPVDPPPGRALVVVFHRHEPNGRQRPSARLSRGEGTREGHIAEMEDEGGWRDGPQAPAGCSRFSRIRAALP